MTAYLAVETAFNSPAANIKYGEVVTISEHMLQTANHASSNGADDHTVLAALLHDVGHLLAAIDSDDRNRRHADAGADWLAELGFPPTVTEPVRLHIPAKRYLVSVDATYHDQLSPASVHTLELQGGALSDEQAAAFRDDPFADVALAVRRWDEAAKVEHAIVPALSHYTALIDRSARSSA